MSTPYSLNQQAFTLSMMANADGKANATGDVEKLTADLTTSIDNHFKDSKLIALIGSWSRVWGPYVWQAQGSNVADNAMFCAYNQQANTYIVAIAATNSFSTFDIHTEDLSVGTVELLPNGDGSANIAKGSLTGLQNLLNLGGPSNTLAQYLQGVSSAASAKLMITGHSLGGGLAPLLAVSLFNSTGGVLAKSGWKVNNVGVYPTAAPSVGDVNFLTLYNRTFASRAMNQRYYNTLDIVPQAWDPETFSANLADIYSSFGLKPSDCIQTLVKNATELPPAPNPYRALPSQTFAGKFYDKGLLPFADDTCYFLAEMMYQHIYAYFEQLTPELIDPNTRLNPPFNPTNPFSTEGRVEIGVACQEVEIYCKSH